MPAQVCGRCGSRVLMSPAGVCPACNNEATLRYAPAAPDARVMRDTPDTPDAPDAPDAPSVEGELARAAVVLAVLGLLCALALPSIARQVTPPPVAELPGEVYDPDGVTVWIMQHVFIVSLLVGLASLVAWALAVARSVRRGGPGTRSVARLLTLTPGVLIVSFVLWLRAALRYGWLAS